MDTVTLFVPDAPYVEISGGNVTLRYVSGERTFTRVMPLWAFRISVENSRKALAEYDLRTVAA